MKPNNQPITILVADDDPLVREMIAMILQDDGYAVDTAENGVDALNKFGSGDSIGLIVSDMNMPEMDGLGLIKAVRDMGSDLPIIILTGNSEVTTAIQALKTGASDYILKDENIQDTICISVEKVLEKHFLKKQNQLLLEELARRNEKLEHEKALAQKVQKNILPRDLCFNGFEVGSLYRPSDKIGGDFFDAWENSGTIHFLIGDVSGHSTSSALIMAVSKGILQSLGHTLTDPREIVRTANRMICDIVSDSGMFLTLLYGIFDRSKDELCIVSAGHNPVFVIRGKAITRIDSTGSVLGWDPEDRWEACDTVFSPGSSLVLYTDGLTEVKNLAGHEFGEERLEALLGDGLPASATIKKIMQNVETFCSHEFPDDLTLFIINRIPVCMDEKIISLKFAPLFENVDAARAAVHNACREFYLHPGSALLIGDMLLAVTEAMNNAVEHSGAEDIEIKVIIGPQSIVFRMVTAGARFDPTDGVAFPDLDAADELPEGGFGRALIAEMVDSAKYEYAGGRNILTLEKNMTTKEDMTNGD